MQKMPNDNRADSSQLPPIIGPRKADETGVFCTRIVEFLKDKGDISACGVYRNDFFCVLQLLKSLKKLNSGSWDFESARTWHVTENEMCGPGTQHFFYGEECITRMANARKTLNDGSARSLEFVLSSVELLLNTYQYIDLVYEQLDQCATIFDRTSRIVSMPERLKGTFRYHGEHHGRASYKSEKFVLSFEETDLTDRSFIMDHMNAEEGLNVQVHSLSFPLDGELQKVQTECGEGEIAKACFSMFIKRSLGTDSDVQADIDDPYDGCSWTIRTLSDGKVLARSCL